MRAPINEGISHREGWQGKEGREGAQVIAYIMPPENRRKPAPAIAFRLFHGLVL